MRKSYKPITFTHQTHLYTLTLAEDLLTLIITSPQEENSYQAVVERTDMPAHLKFSFITLENMYWHFRDLGRSVEREELEREGLEVRNMQLHTKVRQNIAGIEVVKDTHFELTPLNQEKQFVKVKQDSKEVSSQIEESQNGQETKCSCKHESGRIDSIEKELQELKNHVNLTDLASRLAVCEKKQDIFAKRLAKDDDKLTRKLFDDRMEEFWAEVTKLRASLAHLSTPSQLHINSDQIRSPSNSSHSLSSHSLSPQKLDMTQIEQPVSFVRRPTNLKQSMRGASFAVTEEQFEQFRMDSQDLSLLQKKVKELDIRLDTFIPARQLALNFSTSQHADKYKIETSRTGYLLTKRSIDKKYQLVGEPLPNQGKSYFQFKLVSVPHGYLHVGVVAASGLKEQSSHVSKNCINYFGGNGSVNDCGNGIFVGKQLQDGDTIIVYFDADARKVKFLLRGHQLAAIGLHEGEFKEGILPYVQLFYGSSRVEIINA